MLSGSQPAKEKDAGKWLNEVLSNSQRIVHNMQDKEWEGSQHLKQSYKHWLKHLSAKGLPDRVKYYLQTWVFLSMWIRSSDAQWLKIQFPNQNCQDKLVGLQHKDQETEKTIASVSLSVDLEKATVVFKSSAKSTLQSALNRNCHTVSPQKQNKTKNNEQATHYTLLLLHAIISMGLPNWILLFLS